MEGWLLTIQQGGGEQKQPWPKFKVLSPDSPEGQRKITETLPRKWTPHWQLNIAPPKYKVGMLVTWQWHLVNYVSSSSGFTFVLWWQSCCVRGRAGPAWPWTQHGCHHNMKVKPEAATAVIELLMMGGKMPKTWWAVNKCQDNKLKNCCIWLVIYLNWTMMHGLTDFK